MYNIIYNIYNISIYIYMYNFAIYVCLKLLIG